MEGVKKCLLGLLEIPTYYKEYQKIVDKVEKIKIMAQRVHNYENAEKKL